MKYSMFTMLTLISLSSFGLSDLERGALFYSNTYSYGTFLPDMEGRMAQIKLEYEKRKSELKLNFEANLKASQIEQIKAEININKEQIHYFRTERANVEAKLKSFAILVGYAQRLFKGSVARELILEEVEIYAEEDESFKKDWNEILLESGAQDDRVSLTDKNELIFSTSLEVQSQIEVLQSSIQTQLDSLEMETQQLNEQLKVLQ